MSEQAVIRWLGQRWQDPLAAHLVAPLVALQRSPQEQTLAWLEVLPSEELFPQPKQAWLWVTDEAASLVGLVGSEPSLMVLAELGPQAPVKLRSSTLSRDRIEDAERGRALFFGPLGVGAELRRLVELAQLEPVERLLEAAQDEQARGRWLHANELLASATPRLHERQDQALLARHALQIAQVSVELGLSDKAIGALATLSALRPDDDLLETLPADKSQRANWALLLAIAHEERADHRSAAAAYRVAWELEPQRWRLQLQQARCAALAQDIIQAVDAYRAFIKRYAQEAQPWLNSPTAEPDALSLASLELGQLLEQGSRFHDAAQVYLELLRARPFALEAYKRLFALSAQLHDHPLVSLGLLPQLAILAKLLDPNIARQLDDEDVRWRERDEARCWFGVVDDALSEREHEELLRHPGERERAQIAQRWFGELLVQAESAGELELHCQRLDSARHPELMEKLERLASFLGVMMPRCYLSHGLPGARVLGGATSPLILVGAAHFEQESAWALSLREQVFIVGAQLEHIRAQHVILTSSEFWGAFRAKSLDGAALALSLVPIGGMLGKVTDKMLGPLLKKLAEPGVQTPLIKSLSSYLGQKLEQQVSADGLQSTYEATLGKLIIFGQRGPSQPAETLLKEQLADFARAAMYTADRVGLLACDDLEEATRALLKLSRGGPGALELLMTQGVAGLLAQDQEAQRLEELLGRLSQLYQFAISEDYLRMRARLHPPKSEHTS